MNRREAIAQIIAGGGGATALVDTGDSHWLDCVSSQEIEEVLRDIGQFAAFRRGYDRLRRKSQARRRRERRADNTVLWRGIVTDDLPPEVTERLTVVAAQRRDVRIASINQAFVFQGQTLFPGSRVLIDSRVRNITDQRGEIIDTPHKGRRLHIWPR